MHEIPHAVLSERFQDLLKGRRLQSAVFLTFRFEPDFFEQEVLPAILPDVGLSHVPAVRLVQLEDVLRSDVERQLAVYYDRTGLIPGSQTPRLDVARIATNHPTGIFHPKNVLLLTEASEPAPDGRRAPSLIVGTMSANLTRAGWWENVEVCHVEEARQGEACSFRDDLLGLIKQVKRASPVGTNHETLDGIRDFVRRLERRKHRSAHKVLHPRLYAGGKTVADFLKDQLGGFADGLCLEVISPYFDKHTAAPLRGLCRRFSPREVRVFLPRAEDGSALCDAELYDDVRSIENTTWARLPAELLRAGKSEMAKQRMVHAKVYRFFNPTRRYEALFVGSVNLTSAAHSSGGNLESAFLIETVPSRVPDWWLEAESKKPSSFLAGEPEEVTTATTSLSVRYDWSRNSASAFWDAGRSPGVLELFAQGAPLFRIESLPCREWTALSRNDADSLGRILPSTSFLEVSEDGGTRAVILVQEEGMAHKPSILFSLSAADILRYWSLLTAEQRVAFLGERLDELTEVLGKLGVEAPPLESVPDSLFDTFAGIYHAFHALERHVLAALDEGREKQAEYRLLGRKYDSLPSLLDRVSKDESGDIVTRYITVLCARQVVQQVERAAPAFRDAHRQSFRSLKAQLTRAERLRDRLEVASSEPAFLDWFDRWFLVRARPIEVEG